MKIDISPIDFNNKEESNFILNECGKAFAEHMGIQRGTDEEKIEAVIRYTEPLINKEICIKAVDPVSKKIVGFYLLNDSKRLNNFMRHIPERAWKYLNEPALEGVAIVVLPGFEKRGIGKQLIEHTENMGYHFIFGMQVHSLNNLDFWHSMGRNLLQKTYALNVTGKMSDNFLKENKEPNIVPKLIHQFQPDGITCGPTCIKMVAEAYDKGRFLSIKQLSNYGEVDHKTGSTLDKMMLMMNIVDIIYRSPKKENKNMNYMINEVLNRGNFAIVRTLTQGQKHWILAYAHKDGIISIMDPAQGNITYNLEQFESVWAPRNYDFFEIVHADNMPAVIKVPKYDFKI